MYKRVLLKLSGEALGIKDSSNIIDVESLHSICEKIKILHDDGMEVAIVIGAGNIWRGKVAEKIGIERVPADYMGMLGTVINAVAMSSALKKIGVPSVVYSAIPEIKEVTIAYDADKVKSDLSQGKICFLAGGTGKPFFTTDTAAALRASEIGADIILLAKNVDAVYDSDPDENPDAKKFDRLSHMDLVEKNLKVMDLTAATLCSDNHIKIHVFALAEGGNIKRAVLGEKIGTIIE